MPPPLLAIENLTVAFHTREGVVRAVQEVSFALGAGEILGLVGESGSGKSVTALALLGLLPQPPARIESGAAHFAGIDLLTCPPAALRALRGRRIGMIFQDPMTALNPYLRIGEQVIEALRIHERIPLAAARARALELLAQVGINDPARRYDQYPHEISGGMRQRVMIAAALIARPEILIADEPTTALDVTVQAQIVDLLQSLRRELGLAIIFITHDLGVVAGLCDRVQVMYAGRLVETAPVEALYARPQHPYTRALLQSIPARQARGRPLPTVPGAPPDPLHRPPGCAFAPRCPLAQPACRVDPPPALLPSTPEHAHACPIVANASRPPVQAGPRVP